VRVLRRGSGGAVRFSPRGRPGAGTAGRHRRMSPRRRPWQRRSRRDRRAEPI